MCRWKLEVISERMERAVGEYAMKLIRRNLAFWETSGNQAAIEEWRQRQMRQMYSFSEFLGGIRQRFCLLRQLCNIMARLALEIPDDTHRKLKTLAACFGMSMKDFLITCALDPVAKTTAAVDTEAVNRIDKMLFSEPRHPLSQNVWNHSVG